MTQLLDLNTLVDRPTVRIDGRDYELRHRDELSLLEDHRIVALNRRAADLGEFADATEEQVAETVAALDEILGMLNKELPLDALTDLQKAAIARAWAGQYATAASGETESSPTKPRTGAK